MSQFGKILILFGFVLIVSGIVLSFGKNIPFLAKLGHLPGDLIIKKDNFTLYFPWVTCGLISIVVYVITKIFRR
jgi:hypothetical protein